MGVIKYTKENLQIIKDCKSIHEAVIKLGIKKPNNRLRLLIKEILIENGSYLGQAYLRGQTYIKKSNDEFFINVKTGRATGATKEALFKRGLKDKICENCKLTTWLDKNIPLEIHHIDGNRDNNKLENLKILCPNCHSFTTTYRGKNIKKQVYAN